MSSLAPVPHPRQEARVHRLPIPTKQPGAHKKNQKPKSILVGRKEKLQKGDSRWDALVISPRDGYFDPMEFYSAPSSEPRASVPIDSVLSANFWFHPRILPSVRKATNTTKSADDVMEGLKVIGVGTTTIALAGAVVGIGKIFSSLIHLVARNLIRILRFTTVSSLPHKVEIHLSTCLSTSEHSVQVLQRSTTWLGQIFTHYPSSNLLICIAPNYRSNLADEKENYVLLLSRHTYPQRIHGIFADCVEGNVPKLGI
nr:ATP synthase F0 subunit 9, mitochondrial [Tanacetum cinerariifolium]